MDSLSPPSFPSKFAYQMQFEQKVNAATPVAVPIAVAGGHAVAHAVPIAVAAPVGGGGDHADATRQFLASEGFPRGLAEQVLKTKETFPLRYWVVDNSGSMGINDGMKVKKRGQAPVQCTRWEELQVWRCSCLSPTCELNCPWPMLRTPSAVVTSPPAPPRSHVSIVAKPTQDDVESLPFPSIPRALRRLLVPTAISC